MKLNSSQKKYLLDSMFEPGDIYKIFDALSEDWLLKQDWELRGQGYDWYDVFVNGVEYTSINFEVYPEVLDKLKALG